MNARAIIIVIGFSSISVELKNPVIKSVLYHRGFENLYQSLNLAFSALPFFLSNLSKPGKNKNAISKKSLSGILNRAEMLFRLFEKENQIKPEIVIITEISIRAKPLFSGNC